MTPVRRNEDPRLLRGMGAYVDDIDPPGVLHAAILRSPYGHARIGSLDVSAARAYPGVHAVFTAADLADFNQPAPLVVPHPSLTHGRTQRPLAVDKVCYIGEAVAMVVADDRYIAEDAVGLIDVDWPPLLAEVEFCVTDQEGQPVVHDGVPRKVSSLLIQVVGDPESAFHNAAHIFEERLFIERSC